MIRGLAKAGQRPHDAAMNAVTTAPDPARAPDRLLCVDQGVPPRHAFWLLHPVATVRVSPSVPWERPAARAV